MNTVLHILKSQPDDTVTALIESLSRETAVRVVGLYPDEISGTSVDWERLVEDIFACDRVICWW